MLAMLIMASSDHLQDRHHSNDKLGDAQPGPLLLSPCDTCSCAFLMPSLAAWNTSSRSAQLVNGQVAKGTQ